MNTVSRSIRRRPKAPIVKAETHWLRRLDARCSAAREGAGRFINKAMSLLRLPPPDPFANDPARHPHGAGYWCCRSR